MRGLERRESLRPLFPDDVEYSHYVNRMAIIGEWGDTITLNLMGIIWEINIAVLRPNGEGGYVWNRVYEGEREGGYLCLYFEVSTMRTW